MGVKNCQFSDFRGIFFVIQQVLFISKMELGGSVFVNIASD